MSYIVPIIPISKNLTKDNLVDNFDERTIINDDLNMAGYKIYNLKNPVDDYDGVTKYYVDTKVFNINSANITGMLSWNRLMDIPLYFTTKTSSLLVDSNIEIGNYKFLKNGNEIIGLSNSSVTNNYIADNAVSDSKINSVNYSKLTNVPTSFPSKTSTLIIDSDVAIDPYKMMVANPTENAQVANKSYVDSAIANISLPPIGSIVIWATSNIPTNWIECNGQAVNQSLYPDLYALMTSVPDLRGVFVRGLDRTRGLDPSRTLGSLQTHSYQSHTHSVTGSTSSYSHSHTYSDSYYYDETTTPPVLTPTGDQTGQNRDQTRTTSTDTHSHTINLTSGASGGTETRPTNVALIYIIKAK